jgi:hypothetical protein
MENSKTNSWHCYHSFYFLVSRGTECLVRSANPISKEKECSREIMHSPSVSICWHERVHLIGFSLWGNLQDYCCHISNMAIVHLSFLIFSRGLWLPATFKSDTHLQTPQSSIFSGLSWLWTLVQCLLDFFRFIPLFVLYSTQHISSHHYTKCSVNIVWPACKVC